MTEQFDDFFYEPMCQEPFIPMIPFEPIWTPLDSKEAKEKCEESESNDTAETSHRKTSLDEQDDLNKKVDMIIANSRTFKKRKHLGKKSSEPAFRCKKAKIRKTNDQVEILKVYYKPNWTKQEITNLSKLTGLTELQVYKWSWDQANKKTL